MNSCRRMMKNMQRDEQMWWKKCSVMRMQKLLKGISITMGSSSVYHRRQETTNSRVFSAKHDIHSPLAVGNQCVHMPFEIETHPLELFWKVLFGQLKVVSHGATKSESFVAERFKSAATMAHTHAPAHPSCGRARPRLPQQLLSAIRPLVPSSSDESHCTATAIARGQRSVVKRCDVTRTR